MSKITKIRLLIIDPQVDFCEGGALPVTGANADMERLAVMIDRLGSKIDDISVTLDSHRIIDIAHPAWWVDSQGRNPAPYTMISSSDVVSGRWTPRNPAWRARCLDYVRQLETSGKYVLLIWPPHCLIGSPGHNVHHSLFAALKRWEEREFGAINYVTKGTNPFTEHYSAVQAEVPDPSDPTTMINAGLLSDLQDCDTLLIAGEALSHCVKSTVMDIADNIDPAEVRKFMFLQDCSSSVEAVPGGPDFPAMGLAFVADMQKRGMGVTTSTQFLA